uniref:Uncharacterized protein n=1 Tax=Arundo donax TaxID=35708 RepID=A0A0A8YH74_ARUDO
MGTKFIWVVKWVDVPTEKLKTYRIHSSNFLQHKT